MPAVEEDVKTGAEATPGDSSNPPEASTQETDSTGEDQVKETKPEVVSTDKKEEDVKPDSNGRIPYSRFKEVNEKAKEYGEVLTKLKDIGIESPDDAEFIAGQAKRIENIENQLSTDPLAFERDLHKHFPEAQQAIAQNTVTRYLQRQAAAYRTAGNEEAAKAFEDDLAALKGTESARRPEPRNTEPDSVANDKWALFEEKVTDDISSRLSGKISEFVTSKGVKFRNDAQAEKFYQRVMEGVAESLDGNDNFVKQRDQAQSPARGLTKSQRKEVADLYERYSTSNGRLEKAILEELAVMNLSPAGKHIPPERREVNGVGSAPEGGITKASKDKIYDDLYKQGLRGSDLNARYMGELRKLRTGK